MESRSSYEKGAVVAKRIKRSTPGSISIVCFVCFGLFRNAVVEVQARDEKIDLSAPRVSLLVRLVGSSAVSRLVDRSTEFGKCAW